MGISEVDPAQEVLDLLKIASERDKQTLVGPSSLGNPCTYCLAQEMAHGPRPQSKYWMGARIGTAIHHELEGLILKHRPETQPETRVVVGEIPGYGVIKGTADWYAEPDLNDFKTTTRDKAAWLKRAFEEEPHDLEPSKITEARLKLATYWYQTSLYAKGLEDTGKRVERLNLIFINRDGKEDSDVWSLSREYDRALAEKALTRATNLWNYIREGNDIEALPSAKGCWPCGVEGRV